MNATDAVVEFVRTASRPESALQSTQEHLDVFARDVQAGSDSKLVDALRRSVYQPQSPIAQAWILGTAAVFAGNSALWTAAFAAVTALQDGGEVADGRALQAISIGAAVANAVAGAVGDSHAEQGWSARATVGVIGATAAAGYLLGLDDIQLRNAIGIAAVQSAGLGKAEGTDGEALQIGKAASNAVEAALLARGGMTSSEDSLGGRRGLFALMSTDADPERVAQALAVA